MTSMAYLIFWVQPDLDPPLYFICLLNYFFFLLLEKYLDNDLRETKKRKILYISTRCEWLLYAVAVKDQLWLFDFEDTNVHNKTYVHCRW